MLGSTNLIECTDDAIARTNIGVGSTDDPTFSQVHVGTPTLNDHAVTLAHHNTAANLKAPLASPALTGTPTAPTAAIGTSTTQLATTAFVDAEAVAKAGDTMGGLLTLSGPPTAILHAATKKYVDDATSGVPAAQKTNILTPHEGLVISRTNNTTVQVAAEGVVLFNTTGGESALVLCLKHSISQRQASTVALVSLKALICGTTSGRSAKLMARLRRC